MGLQLYMGVLTQKCILRFPEDGSYGNLTDESWHRFCSNDCKQKKKNLINLIKIGSHDLPISFFVFFAPS